MIPGTDLQWLGIRVCKHPVYTPKSAQNSLKSMIQLKYEHDHDPVKLTYDFAVAVFTQC
jgi:hypothetical protein